MLNVVTNREIQKILDLTDRLGIHREAVVIPLAPGRPGRVRRRPDGKIEIVVDAEREFDAWLAGLEGEIRELGGGTTREGGWPGPSGRT